MALNPAVGNLISVRFEYENIATGIAMNVLHFKVSALTGTVPSNTEFLTATAGQCLSQWGEAWKEAASDQVVLWRCKATNVFPLPRSVGITAVSVAGIPGDEIGEALPLQDSVTILKRTAVGNRWGLGRLFFTGIPETFQSNGIISQEYVTKLADAITFLTTPRTIVGLNWSATLQLVLVRGPEDNPVSITDVINAQLSNTIIKSQRRRRPGKGI